jgi:hypothetical protein
MTRAPAPLLAGALAAALALVAVPGRARATSNDCSNIPDGTPCHIECLQDGKCLGGKCLGGRAVPDGTQCATGSYCTTGDQCKEGICQAGPPLVCGLGPCGPQSCFEGFGCLADNPCDMPPPAPDLSELPDGWQPPDLADPQAPDGAAPDLSQPPLADAGVADAAVPADASVTPDGPTSADLAKVPDAGGADLEPDAAVPDLGPADGGDRPDGGDLVDGGEAQDGGEEADAAGLDPDGGDPADRWIHLHGSGCTLAAPPASPSGLLLLVLLPLGALALRRRRR